MSNDGNKNLKIDFSKQLFSKNILTVKIWKYHSGINYDGFINYKPSYKFFKEGKINKISGDVTIYDFPLDLDLERFIRQEYLKEEEVKDGRRN